jgi:predicted ATPase
MEAMFTRVQAENYRCLRDVSVELGPYQILVGPNASGKSTLLDVIPFLSELITVGPRSAAIDRSDNFHDLVWGRAGYSFRLAVEMRVPSITADFNHSPNFRTIRYEVQIKLDPVSDDVSLDQEKLTLIKTSGESWTVLERTNHRVRYQSENGEPPVDFTLGTAQSGLANLPMDQTKFPKSVWFKNALQAGIQMVVLDNETLRASSPPGQGHQSYFNGLNLPRRIAALAEARPADFEAWTRHVRTALPDIETIKTVLRPEDKHRYLMVRYDNGIEVPAWMLSDGTLRLIALTLLAYVPEVNGVYLIEEPEVGVHPSAFETILQSLSSVYEGQVIMTTHSPLLVGLTDPERILCFSRSGEGTHVIKGSEHPLLQDWQSKIELSDLFAAGVLG